MVALTATPFSCRIRVNKIGYTETGVFTPAVRLGDAMFIAGGMDENL